MKTVPVRIVAVLWGLLALAAVGQALTEQQKAEPPVMSAASR